MDRISNSDNVRQKRQQLPEEVAAYVRGLIVSGQVQPGEFIRMEPIAEAVGVSNTPVREGLLTLRSEGFLRLEPRRGYIVAPFDRQDIRDLFWAQAQLAGELAARAAEKMDEAQLEELMRLNDEHEKAMRDGDMEKYSDLGHAFHRVINKAAQSDRLAALLNMIVKQLPSRFYVGIKGHAEAAGSMHRDLVELLRDGKADEAREVMEEHVMMGAESLITSLEGQGVFGANDESVSTSK